MNTKTKFENEILTLEGNIQELENQYFQAETSFNSRVDKIKERMFADFMMRRKIYESEIEKMMSKIKKNKTKKFVEGMVIAYTRWDGQKEFGVINRVVEQDRWGWSGFYFNTIGVSGVGTKKTSVSSEHYEEKIEIITHINKFVKLCEKYGIDKPKMNKHNLSVIYQKVFNKRFDESITHLDLTKLGIIV